MKPAGQSSRKGDCWVVCHCEIEMIEFDNVANMTEGVNLREHLKTIVHEMIYALLRVLSYVTVASVILRTTS